MILLNITKTLDAELLVWGGSSPGELVVVVGCRGPELLLDVYERFDEGTIEIQVLCDVLDEPSLVAGRQRLRSR